MYVLEHYDWFGPIKDLEEVEKKIKEHLKGIWCRVSRAFLTRKQRVPLDKFL